MNALFITNEQHNFAIQKQVDKQRKYYSEQENEYETVMMFLYNLYFEKIKRKIKVALTKNKHTFSIKFDKTKFILKYHRYTPLKILNLFLEQLQMMNIY